LGRVRQRLGVAGCGRILLAMSKAFTSEETADDPLVVAPRPPLPAGVPNYVTQRGLALLRSELQALEQQQSELAASGDVGARLPTLVKRVAELSARIGGALEVDTSTHPPDEVRFGALVTVRDAGGQLRHYEIVGVDEANGREGRVAFTSPVARALLGRKVGDTAVLGSPRGEEELQVVEIRYTG
jgi:transcription elongation factor GreB